MSKGQGVIDITWLVASKVAAAVHDDPVKQVCLFETGILQAEARDFGAVRVRSRIDDAQLDQRYEEPA